MSTTPFSRPGAIDLSALKRPAAPPPGPGAGSGAPGGPGSGSGGQGTAAYTVLVDEQNFTELLESSMSAPVVLVVYSPSRSLASGRLADDLEVVAEESEGRFLLGRIDVDAQPAIAQAMQVQQVPLVAMVLQGRLAPLLQDAPPLTELRTIMSQVLQQMAAQGMTGRHQPRGAVPADGGEGGVAEDLVDPRHVPAEEALMAGDIDRAVEEYQKLVTANPADIEAALGLARAQLMQRTAGVDLNAARRAAAASPDDVEAQLLVADLDLLGGHVDDAFGRLVDLVRRTSGDDRDRARLHLISLFDVVGNEDPRVLRGRQNLASALL
jgi:putative thioredoxin